MGGPLSPSINFLALLLGVLRRWKLIIAITLSVSIASYGVVQLIPSLYRSTVEILVFDPQQQVDAAIQKAISPFVDAVGDDAMNTEIQIIQSKSVALRVARELGLDRDPEFQPSKFHLRGELAGLAKRLGFPGLAQALTNGTPTIEGAEAGKTEKLDQAADALRRRLEVSHDSYIISVSATSQNPIEAQRLAAAIAADYLASQREAREEAVQRVANWLKNRVDNL